MVGKTKASPDQGTLPIDVPDAVEDGTEKGGLFSEMAEFLSRRAASCRVSANGNDVQSPGSPRLLHIALPDRFISHGDIPSLYREVGFDEEAIAGKVREAWSFRI